MRDNRVSGFAPTSAGRIGRPRACLAVGAMVVATIALGSVSRAEEASSTALTIYSSATPGAIPPELYRPNVAGIDRRGITIPGYALIRHERGVDLTGPRTTLRFSDVAAQIDPTTVSFSSLTDPDGTRVLEQSFEFDLVSTAKLMERYIDRPITVEQIQGDHVAEISGTLLSTAGGIVLAGADGKVQVVNGYSTARFPELPGGLITRPTLVWSLAAEKPGAQRVRVTYETTGITWWTDYNLIFAEGKDANSGVLDVGAWVSVVNQSGASYPDAKLKLVAGDVHRAPRPMGGAAGAQRRAKFMYDAAEAVAGFEEKSFFEYHLYTLGRPTTIPDNSTKQIELFPAARGVPCEKVMVYYGLPLPSDYGLFSEPMTDRNFGQGSNPKVDIYLRFKNDKESGMGMPLPSGRIRVSKLDPADGSLEFIGEDRIDHTPKDEKVLVKLGSAFDVVGERRQVDFRVDTARKWIEEEYEIKLRNHKEEPVKVIIKENGYRWSNWQIIKKSHEFEKVDSRTIHFPVEVAKDGETVVTYTVKYTW